jgi:4-hydroxyphenylpyruvate dioxygenase
MRRVIATAGLGGSLEEKLGAAAAAGFDGVELSEAELIGSYRSLEALRRCAADLGLAIVLYQPLRDFEGVDDAAFARNLRRAARTLDIVQRLGAEQLVVCSNVSEQTIGDDGRAAIHLRALAELAAARGVRVAYQALRSGRHVRHPADAWAIVDAADHPALGLGVDSGQAPSPGAAASAIDEVPGGQIFFVRIADPRGPEAALRHQAPSRGGPSEEAGPAFDTTLARVLERGYDGVLSITADGSEQLTPQRAANNAMRTLLLTEEGHGPSSSVPGERALTPAPALAGYAFVELTVDGGSSFDVERLLREMGFTHVGEHPSNRVDLWQQDEIRLLLSRSPEIADPPRVAAIAVESADLASTARRAQQLLAPPIPLQHRPEIEAIAAPDETAIFFCATVRPETPSWLDDFVALTPAPARVRGGLLEIDHVALCQPADRLAESMLFFGSVLGLAPRVGEEPAPPSAGARSCALEGPHARLRLILDAPPPSWQACASGEHAPHVAFASGDALRTARAYAEAGVPVMQVSQNYYDDLAARLDPHPELLAELCEYGVMYDRRDGGEFLHFYVEVPGSGLCFEIVERRGAYDGYGGVNAPVRVARQKARHAAARER